MAIRNLLSKQAGEDRIQITHVLGIALLAVFLVTLGFTSCKPAEEESETGDETVALEEGQLEFSGTVKLAVGKYVYIPDFQGFDIVVQGDVQVGDVSTLVGKEVRGIGEFTPERPSILVANTIEVKDDMGNWQSVYTRTGELVLSDYLDLNSRNEYIKLDNLSYDKKDDWEAQAQAKVSGKLEETEDGYSIAVMDAEGKEVGKVIVDNLSEFSQYYVKKLSLFDRFWFYLSIKETVDWAVRRRTREMFHADVLFAGLF